MRRITRTNRFLAAAALSLYGIAAHGYDFMVDGICYNKTSGTECEVTYEVYNRYNYDAPRYNNLFGIIVIPSSVEYEETVYSVTSIGDEAFSYCSGLTSVDIPNSVISIGDGAFRDCYGLISVDIPNSVTYIGEWAFASCHGLTSVNIPNSVTSIGEAAFWGCYRLPSVTIGNSVTLIGGGAFRNCTSLTSVDIPNSVSFIGDGAFAKCINLTSVDIPNSVTSIEDEVFRDCTSLASVNIGNSVTSIGDYAFSGCDGLTSVDIPNSVDSIGEYAFDNCSNLTSICAKPTTPPDCWTTTFDEKTQKNGTLYVPEEALEDYKNAYEWKDFFHIEGCDFTDAVGGVTVTPEADAPYRIHGLDGSLVRTGKGTPDLGGLPKGVYVVNGRKVLVE